MKKEIADKWIKALRSGYYKQTTHKLKDHDGYCCLGVLCNISKLAKWEEREGDRMIYGDQDTSMLPINVRRWAGIRTPAGAIPEKTLPPYNNLVQLNDNEKSFKEIADVIEENYEYL